MYAALLRIRAPEAKERLGICRGHRGYLLERKSSQFSQRLRRVFDHEGFACLSPKGNWSEVGGVRFNHDPIKRNDRGAFANHLRIFVGEDAGE